MTYQEYCVSKTNNYHYIYQGETEQELLLVLKQKFNYDTTFFNEDEKYSSFKPPAGIILVGDDVNYGWIENKYAFYGWNIHFIKGVSSDKISIK